MKQIISKNGKVVAVTAIPYDNETLKSMRAAGYKIKVVENDL